MIQTWRIMSGKDMVKVETWFDMEMDRQRAGATTTRHATQHHAIRPRNYHYKERGKFFSNRVVQDYNSLPSWVTSIRHQCIQEQSRQAQGDPKQDSQQAHTQPSGKGKQEQGIS